MRKLICISSFFFFFFSSVQAQPLNTTGCTLTVHSGQQPLNMYFNISGTLASNADGGCQTSGAWPSPVVYQSITMSAYQTNTYNFTLNDGWYGTIWIAQSGYPLPYYGSFSLVCGGQWLSFGSNFNGAGPLLVGVGCPIFGCTDPADCNYNANANTNDGSCTGPSGCTDPTAINYNPLAGCDDGSCTYPSGCTDPIALNYNSSAIIDDGSCCYISGCTDPSFLNYNSNACYDDGSCCSSSIVVDLGSDFSTCDSIVTLSLDSGYSYNWSTGETTQSINVTQTGSYSVDVSSIITNNNSLSFNGSGDVDLHHPNGTPPINSFSFSTWYKLPAPTGSDSIMIVTGTDWSSIGGHGGYLDPNGWGIMQERVAPFRYYLYFMGATHTPPFTNFQFNHWYYLTVTFNNGIVKLFIDGIEVFSFTALNTTISSTNFRLGK